MKSRLLKPNMPALLMIAAIISLCLNTAVYAQWGSLGDDRMSSGGTGEQKGGNSQKLDPYTQEQNDIPIHQAPTVYTPSAAGIPNSSFMPYVSSGVPNGGFASYAPLAPVPAGVQVNANGLPPTTLDSFVKTSGGNTYIYGDEGTGLFGPPPINGLTEANAINAGIVGINNKGLTTDHGSYMPDASGVGWSMSGARDPHAKAKKELARHEAEIEEEDEK